jgi:hypothetical protein
MNDNLPWYKLEQIIVINDSAQKDLAKKYPNEMVRWSILRRRNGQYCPMARGVLKLIAYNERKNADFNNNLEEGTWTRIWT